MGCTSFQEGGYSNAEAIISLVGIYAAKGCGFWPFGKDIGSGFEYSFQTRPRLKNALWRRNVFHIRQVWNHSLWSKIRDGFLEPCRESVQEFFKNALLREYIGSQL